RAGEAARRTPEDDDSRQDRPARGLSLLRQGCRHQRTDHRRAQQRNLSLFAAAPDPRAASLGWLDGGEARRTAQKRVQAVVHAARALRRRAQLGSGLMAIVYDKLLALKIPDVERTYATRDPIFYALSLGLGQDRVTAKERPFVYEKGVRVLPPFAVVVAQPGQWARELDTGIDWVKIVHGEHDLVIHKPLPASGTVTSNTRIIEAI